MKQLLVAAFVLFSSSLAFSQSKCFENNGLKDGHSIEMSISGRSVTGSFGIAPDFDTDRVKRYDFTGTVSGTVLTVKFSDQSPDSLPTTPASKRWTIVRSASGEKLRVTLFGKNYETNKWSNYTALKRNSKRHSQTSQTGSKLAKTCRLPWQICGKPQPIKAVTANRR